jgi:hypothetical protein
MFLRRNRKVGDSVRQPELPGYSKQPLLRTKVASYEIKVAMIGKYQIATAIVGVLVLLVLLPAWTTAGGEQPGVEIPRIESVIPLPRQPQENEPSTIWYDDFNGPEKIYGEASGQLDDNESFGGPGKSLACVYEKGSQGNGVRKVFFGDTPANQNKAVRKGERFDEIYWRIYVKHQFGWTGGGEAKLSRATSLIAENWTQAMIAHVWSGPGETLTLDPASGVRGDQVVTTRYNDFANLRWLGNSPASTFKFSSSTEAGWWVCVEAYAKLNTPGKKDGVNRLWIDGRLEAERKNLDWRGSYTGHSINALFLESYWNQGSPVTQTRWIDNFVISTKPIGPVVCPANPILVKTPYRGVGKPAVWEVQLAADRDGEQVVWKSKPITQDGRIRVDSATGQFAGILEGKSELAAGMSYCCRVRQRSSASETAGVAWSPWHQHFVVGGTATHAKAAMR